MSEVVTQLDLQNHINRDYRQVHQGLWEHAKAYIDSTDTEVEEDQIDDEMTHDETWRDFTCVGRTGYIGQRYVILSVHCATETWADGLAWIQLHRDGETAGWRYYFHASGAIKSVVPDAAADYDSGEVTLPLTNGQFHYKSLEADGGVVTVKIVGYKNGTGAGDTGHTHLLAEIADLPTSDITTTGAITCGDLTTKGPWVDVRAYGAIGDGVTDDTVAFTDALATGKPVLIPKGIYLCDAFTIPTGGILQGYGLCSIIKKAPDQMNIAFITLTGTAQLRHVYVEGNYTNMDSGSNDKTLGTAVVPSGTGAVIHDVYIHDSDSSSIASSDAIDCTITDVILDTYQDHALYFTTTSNNVKVRGFHAKSATSSTDGILKVRNGASNITFENGYVDSPDYLLSVQCSTTGCSNIIVRNVSGTVGIGVLVSKSTAQDVISSNVRIEGCDITGDGAVANCLKTWWASAYNGIDSLFVKNNRFSNFLIFASLAGGDGIYHTVKPRLVEISGNTIIGAAAATVAFSTLAYQFVRISNNFIDWSATAGDQNLIYAPTADFLIIEDNTTDKFQHVFSGVTTFLTDGPIYCMGNTFLNQVSRFVNCATSDGQPKSKLYDLNNIPLCPTTSSFHADYAGKIIHFFGAGKDQAAAIDMIENTLKAELSVKIKEQAAAVADSPGYGQLWVKNTTPCELWFTDDAGTDTQIV